MTGALTILALCVSGCDARPSAGQTTSADLLTGREVHALQNSTAMETAAIVEFGPHRYTIPKAPYVELSEVGRGTPSAHYQAYLTLRSVNIDDRWSARIRPILSRVTASIGFGVPHLPGGLPTPDENWIKSDQGLPDFPGVDLWLNTQECIDDRLPALSPEKKVVFIEAIWNVDDVPLYIKCFTGLEPMPSGQYYMTCHGRSELTLSDVAILFTGLVPLDRGCRNALETLVPSFAYLPLIVADWRED